MAIEDISIRLRMAATGVDQQVANSEQIADNYARAATNAQRLAAAQTRAGGQQARAAAMAGSRSSSEMLDYSTAGGVTGRGGASARDFANQAQGLGGLVRLYATVAANVFALTAAFSALSRAMDTTNMIAGLDALGASSGRALGTLSKQLAQVSDGAISLREAMQATAMSSSAGMTNQQILRMGEVAKNASLALGISMPDAINRLSRGIVKLEPELLDELGIFTKIEPAVQSYALQLGKSVSSLTDFERRQAFANAVLKEGEDKFTAIGEQIGANPYDKLSASLKNVAQTGLELVNKVLGPIADLLSKSPTVLTGGLLLLISTLVTKALPALTQFRESLDVERKKAQDLVAKKKEDTLAAGQALGELASRNVLRNMEANAESELRVFENKEKRLNELKKQGANYSAQLNNLLKKDIHDITEAEIAEAKRAAKARLEAARADYRFSFTNEDLQKARAERIAAQAEMGTVLALERTTNAERAYIAARQDGIRTETNRLQLSREFQNLVRAEERMVVQARRSEIIANVAYNTSLLGIRDAFRLMNAEADVAGTRGWDRFTLGLRAGIASIGTIITGALGAIGTIIQAITAAVAVFGLFDAAFSKNAKETQKFNEAVDNSESSIKAVANTIELYQKKNEDSIRSTVALSTAFGELSDSMETTVNRFEKMMAAAGGWDRFWDRVKSVFGYGQEDTLAKVLSDQLYSALDVAQKFGQKGEMQDRLKEFLNIENIFDKDALKKALIALDRAGQAELIGIVDNFKKRFQQIGSTLDSFKSNLEKTYKSTQEFTQSLSSNDPFAKMAESFGQLALDMGKISTLDAGQQLKAFEELVKSPEKLSLFSQSFINGLFEIKQAFTIEKSQVDAYTSAIDKMIGRVDELKQKQFEAQTPAPVSMLPESNIGNLPRSVQQPSVKLPGTTSSNFGQPVPQSFQQEINTLTATVGVYRQIQKEIPTTFGKAADLFTQAADENFRKAADYTAIAIQNASTRAANTIASAYATTLTGPEAVREQARIARSEQQIKVREAKIALDTLDSQDSLQSAIRENTAQLEITTEALKGTPESKTNIARLEQNRDLERAKTMLSQGADPNKVLASVGADPRNRGLRADDQSERGERARKIVAEAERQLGIRNMKMDLARGKLKQEQATLEAINIKEQIDLSTAKLQRDKELLGIENATKQARGAILDIDRQIAGVTTLAGIEAKAAIEDSIRNANNKQEEAEILNRIRLEENAIANTSGDAKKNHEASKKFLEEQLLPAVTARQTAESQLATRKKESDVLNYQIELINKRNEVEKAQLATRFAAEEAQMEINRARFTSMAEIYSLDKRFVSNQLYQLDLQKANFDAQKQISSIILDSKVKEEAAIKRIDALKLSGNDYAKAVAEEQDRQNKLLTEQLAQIEIERQKRLETLKIQRDQVDAQERMNYFMERANSIATTLSENFGKGGARIGQLVEGFSKVSKSIEDSRGAQEAFNRRSEQMTDDSSAEQWATFWQDKDRLEKKSAQDELDRNAMALSSTKKLFKEKTAAYRAFGALEKAYHVARLIMSAKEIATTIANTVSFVTSSITRQTAAATEAGVLGTKAVIKDMAEAPWPISIGAAAATAAAVAALLATIGKSFRGGSGGGRGAVSTEDINKVQGSAMGYNSSGELVQVRPGVLGDTSAKSDSVAKSIAMIEKYTLDGMPINDAQLTYLKLIEKNTKAAAVSIYGASGLRTGKGLGLTEAGSGSTALGKIGSVGGMLAGGAAGGLLGAAISGGGYFLGGAVSTLLGEGLSLALNAFLPGIGILLGGILGKGLMSQSVTRNINQSGLLFSGSLQELATNIEDSVKVFVEGTETKTTKYLFGLAKSSKTKPLFDSKDLKELKEGQQILDALRPIFSSSYKQITGLATELGYGIDKINAAITGEEFTVNLKDLKTSEEIAQALYDGINSYLDTISSTLFAEFKDFQQEGEGLFQTVNRVVYQFKLVNQGLQNIGVSTSYLSKTIEGYGIANMITEIFGGMEAFIDKTEKFRRAFLTEAEQLAPIQKMVTTTLKDLGVSNVDTMNEFKLLVQSIKPVTPEAARLQNTLLDLAPAFEKVYKAADDLLENLRKETVNLTSTLSADEIILRDITIKTAEYVDTLAAAGKATQANVEVVARWSKASALTQLRNNLKAAYDERKRELESNISVLKKFKDTLVNLKNELLVGQESPLAPQERFKVLLDQYQQALTDTRSVDSATAEAARQAFPGLSKQVLSAAKELYGSGQVYQSIFAGVSSDINSLGSYVDQQLTTEERRLDTELKTYSSILNIETSSKTAAQKLEEIAGLYNQVAIADPVAIATSIVANINKGQTAVESVAAALNAQIPVITKATGEAIVTVLGNKTVDTVLSDAVSKVISDANTKAKGIEDAAKAAVTDVKKAGEDGANDVTKAGNTTLTAIDKATSSLTNATTKLVAATSVSDTTTIGTVSSQLLDTSDFSTLVKDLRASEIVQTLSTDPATLQAIDAVLERNNLNQELQIAGLNNQVIDNLTDTSALVNGAIDVIDAALTTLSLDNINNASIIDAANTNSITADAAQSAANNIVAVAADTASAVTDVSTLTENISQDSSNIDAAWMNIAQDVTDIAGQFSLYADAIRETIANADFNVTAIGSRGSSNPDFSSSDMGIFNSGLSGGALAGDGGGGGPGDLMDAIMSQMNAMASGGPVTANTPYIVGEVGPELFVPRTNGTIIPNNYLGQNQDQINQEICEKLDKLIEAVFLSSNNNAKQVVQGFKSNNPTWNPTAFGRV